MFSTDGIGRYNPWNYEYMPRRRNFVLVIEAVSALILTTGILTLLALQGTPVGPFNVLTCLTKWGGGSLTLLGGSGMLFGLAWLIPKALQSIFSSQEETSPQTTTPTPIQSEPLPPPLELPPDPFSTSTSGGNLWNDDNNDNTFPPCPPIQALEKKLNEILILEEKVVEPPKQFPLLENLRKYLPLPHPIYRKNRGSIKVQLKRERDAFVTKMRSYLEGLIEGKVVISVENEEKVLKGELIHPDQVDLVLTFIRSQLTSFNTILVRMNEKHLSEGQNVTVIDIESFFKPYATLIEENEIWRRALKGEAVLQTETEQFSQALESGKGDVPELHKFLTQPLLKIIIQNIQKQKKACRFWETLDEGFQILFKEINNETDSNLKLRRIRQLQQFYRKQTTKYNRYLGNEVLDS